MHKTPTTTALRSTAAWAAMHSRGQAAHTAGVKARAVGAAYLPPFPPYDDSRYWWQEGYHGRPFEPLTDADALKAFAAHHLEGNDRDFQRPPYQLAS